MISSPYFSVVIPTFNHAAYIGKCLESLRQQTFSDWQAIVINNYSQDNTEEIVAGFKDSRIQLVNFKNHGVIAASRNEGLRHSRGRYIAFLDSDDEWLPGKLQAVYEAVQHDPSVVLISHHLRERNTRTGEVRFLDTARPYSFGYRNLLLYGNNLLNSATVVQRDFVERHSIRLNETPGFVSCEDYDFWLQCARHGATHVLIDKVLGIYSVSPGSGSGDFLRHYSRVTELLRWHCYEVQGFTSWRAWLFIRSTAPVELAVASRHWHGGQIGRALVRVLRAFIRNPWCCLYALWCTGSRIRRRRVDQLEPSQT